MFVVDSTNPSSNTVKIIYSDAGINLTKLINAIKYKSEHRPPMIRITSNTEGDYLILRVMDNGRGIDLNKQGEYVFGLYKRFHHDVEGKGLGLHMTKSQVETIGGTIEIESAVEQGTTFTIKIPNR